MLRVNPIRRNYTYFMFDCILEGDDSIHKIKLHILYPEFERWTFFNFQKNSPIRKKHHEHPFLGYMQFTMFHFDSFFTFSQIGEWLSGRVLDSRSKGCRFEPNRRQCVVSLIKTQFNPC